MSSTGNELESGLGGEAAPPQPAGNNRPQSEAQSSLFSHFSGAHGNVQAQYEKLSKADQTLKQVRKIMDKLVALGDMIQEDDVIDAASGLVASGLTSAAVAGLLADAPANPEGLQAWVQQHDADVTKREQQLAMVLANARHSMAVAGLKSLAGHAADAHAEQQEQQQAEAAPPQMEAPSPGANPMETPDAG